jgi:hypothetical protein
MRVAEADFDVVTNRPVPIAPRVLGRILRDVSVRDVTLTGPADLTLADLDAHVSTTLPAATAMVLRRAVVDRVRRRWRVLAGVCPFRELPQNLDLSDLDVSQRAHNVMSRLTSMWLRDATIEDLMEVRGLGAGVLVEVLAEYEQTVPHAASGSVHKPSVVEFTPPVREGERKREVPHRVQTMYSLYQDGASLTEVAEMFGVTRERVSQLFRQYDLRTRSIGEAAALKRQRLADERREEILELLISGKTRGAIARKLSLPESVVSEVTVTDPKLRRLAALSKNSRSRPRKSRYNDDEIIACLRTASVELGGVLTAAEYTRFARTKRFADGRPWPTNQTPAHRFGSWSAALQRAGLEANRPSPIAGQRLFTRAHCVDAILEVERELGHPPTSAEYERAAARSSGILPSLATVRNRCGTWQEALVLAALFSQ